MGSSQGATKKKNMEKIVLTREEAKQLDELFAPHRKYVKDKLHEMYILRRILQDIRSGKEIDSRRLELAEKRLVSFARDFCNADMMEKDGIGQFDESKLRFVYNEKD